MSIQSTVYQGLSVASLLVTQNPALKNLAEKKSKLKNLNAREQGLQQQYEKVSGIEADKYTHPGFEETPDLTRASELESKLGAIAQERFELDPSRENYIEAFAGDYGVSSNIPSEAAAKIEKYRKIEAKAKAEEEARLKAEEELKARQESKRLSRRNFLDYIKDEPTSFGGTVGQLDPKIQKLISKQYTKAQRQSIMNRKDSEQNVKE